MVINLLFLRNIKIKMISGIAIAMIYTFVSMSIFRVMFNAPT